MKLSCKKNFCAKKTFIRKSPWVSLSRKRILCASPIKIVLALVFGEWDSKKKCSPNNFTRDTSPWIQFQIPWMRLAFFRDRTLLCEMLTTWNVHHLFICFDGYFDMWVRRGHAQVLIREAYCCEGHLFQSLKACGRSELIIGRNLEKSPSLSIDLFLVFLMDEFTDFLSCLRHIFRIIDGSPSSIYF